MRTGPHSFVCKNKKDFETEMGKLKVLIKPTTLYGFHGIKKVQEFPPILQKM